MGFRLCLQVRILFWLQKLKIMKILKKFHQELEKGCYPFDPMIIYIFGVIVVGYSLTQIVF